MVLDGHRATSSSRFGSLEIMRIVLAVLSLVLALLALLAPAIWNGFPITFHDTGGYLARWYETEPGNGRATPYGLFIEGLHLGLAYWPAIVAQSLLVIAVVGEAGRSLLGLRGANAVLFAGGATILLALVTGISWYAAQLLPDILAPCAVLALFLLVEGRRGRSLGRQILLFAMVALGAASHTGTVGLLVGLVGFVALAAALGHLARRSAGWSRRTWLRLVGGVFALGFGTFLVPASNWALYDKFVFTPGGDIFLFGRLVQDGIASRYLADHCPDPTLKLCDHQAELYEPDGRQMSNDSFLWWGGSPLYAIGGWETAGPELSRITRASLSAYPTMHLSSAWKSFVGQLGLIGTGDGLNDDHWHARWAIQTYRPEDLAGFQAAEQRKGKIPFDLFNDVHVPVGYAAWLALPLIAVFGFRSGREGVARFSAFTFTALVGNAAICGILSNPHDRYESRLIWLAVLACMVAALAFRRPAEETDK